MFHLKYVPFPFSRSDLDRTWDLESKKGVAHFGAWDWSLGALRPLEAAKLEVPKFQDVLAAVLKCVAATLAPG